MKTFLPKQIILLAFTIILQAFTYPFTYGQSFSETTKAVASDRSTEDYFGEGAAISGDYAIISAAWEDHDATGGDIKVNAGSAYFFHRDTSGNWNQMQKVVASDRAIGDLFGRAVDISGNLAIVGAEQEDEDPDGLNTMLSAGSAYIFELDSTGTWVEVQKIVASDREGGRNFGRAVSITDGRAIVGVPFEMKDAAGINILSNAGAAYIYERDSSGTWNEVEKVVPADRESGDEFGETVSIYGDYAIVGAHREDDDLAGANNLPEAGSAYVFERDGAGNWNQAQKIISSDRWQYERFGHDVAIGDGVAFISALWDDEDETGADSIPYAGAAFIYERDAGGTWIEQQKIVASDRANSDQFGSSVSFSGKLAVVSAYREDEDVAGANTELSAGSAYIFEEDSTGTWTEIQKIVASDRAASDEFGFEVSISGNNVLVSAWQEDEDEFGASTQNLAGSAYFFGRACSPTISSFSVTECESYTVPSGDSTYTTPGTYSIADTIEEPSGCDSIFAINLTILAPIASTFMDTLCDGDSVVINGTTYNALNPSGTEVFTGTGPFGCDSTVTVNISVLAPLSGTLVDTLCNGDSLIVNGTTYNALNPTGTEVFTGIGAHGCDSTVTVDLTILPALSSTLDDTLCNGDSLMVNGTTYNALNPTGIEVFTGIGPHGCDSTVMVNLTVLAPVSSTLEDTLCEGDSLIVNGTTYNALNPSGTEVFVGAGTLGCDSTVNVSLTVMAAIDTTLTFSSPTLTANQTGADYQWIDCGAGDTLIPGATSQSFTPTSNGDYAVIIMMGECQDTSSCENVVLVNMEGDINRAKLSLFPNPNSGTFTLEVPEKGVVFISDLSGKTWFSGNIVKGMNTIDQENLANGMYMLEFFAHSGAVRRKLFQVR